MNNCLNCGKVFYNRLAKNPKYCTTACKREDTKGIQPRCKRCDEPFSLKGSRYRPYCSSACAVAYQKPLKTNAETVGKHTKWANEVKKRDKYMCQRCTSKEEIEAHHIRKRSVFPELKYDINNGVVLCQRCHSWVTNNPKAAENQGWQITRKGSGT